jgi:hypothetical protein
MDYMNYADYVSGPEQSSYSDSLLESQRQQEQLAGLGNWYTNQMEQYNMNAVTPPDPFAEQMSQLKGGMMSGVRGETNSPFAQVYMPDLQGMTSADSYTRNLESDVMANVPNVNPDSTLQSQFSSLWHNPFA